MDKYNSSLSNYQLPRGLRRRLRKKTIVVNVANTRYPIVGQICRDLNYQLSYDRENSQWDVFWTDNAVSIDFVAQMNAKQKVNHFSAMSQLSRKALLASNLKRMQKAFPQSYSFFPLTFILPQDVHLLKKYQERMKANGHKPTYIIKPEVGCQGRGIYLWQDKIELQAKKEIVQVYLQRPLLFKGLKFDMRVYALVTSCAPLRAYLYNQGLVRLATESYQRPNKHNIEHLRMHLTNYAINRQSPKYIFNDSIDDLSKGHKKSLAEFFETMRVMGLPAQQYWGAIKDTTVKTLIAGLPWLKKQMEIAQPDHVMTNFCFELLGFDFILEDNHKVYLLEVNHTPSFFTDTPLDQLLKSNLIKDTLELVTKQHKNKRKTPRKGLSTSTLDQRDLRASQVTFSHSKEVQYDEEDYLVAEKCLGSFQQIHPSLHQNLQQKYQNLISYSLGSVSFNCPARRKSLVFQTPSRKRINTEPKYLTPHQQFSGAPRERIKVSRVIKPEPIARSYTKRAYNQGFDREQFRQEINRRNHPLRQKKIRESNGQYQAIRGDELVDIIDYHKRQQEYSRRKNKPNRQEVHYPYY